MHPSGIHKLLSRYFNTGSLSRRDLILGMLSPSIPFYLNAGIVVTDLKKQHKPLVESEEFESRSFHFSEYQGKNTHVKKISDYLNNHLPEELALVLLHGSLATNEEVNYSDFDGLIIIKSDTLESPKKIINTAIHISTAYRMMTTYDPLQHHGWLILTEYDFIDFPVSLFPVEIFRYCTALSGKAGDFDIRYRIKPETFSNNFISISNSLRKKIQSNYFKKNLFALKGFLSELMLLPSVYYETKYGKGIYKKDSFDAIRQEFTDEQWLPIKIASYIRNNWPEKTYSLKNKSGKVMTAYYKKVIARNAPMVPESMSTLLDHNFFQRTLELLNTMADNLK